MRKKSKSQMLGRILHAEFVYDFQINFFHILNEKLEFALLLTTFYDIVLWCVIHIHPSQDFFHGDLFTFLIEIIQRNLFAEVAGINGKSIFITCFPFDQTPSYH